MCLARWRGSHCWKKETVAPQTFEIGTRTRGTSNHTRSHSARHWRDKAYPGSAPGARMSSEVVWHRPRLCPP
eukprot:6742-Pyramimonas_sp.AAC.1